MKEVYLYIKSWFSLPFQISLHFQAFHLQETKGCQGDYVKVYDGSSKSSPVLMDKTCGSKIPSGMVASSNLMLVEFVTDGAYTGSGFQATFTAGKSENMENGKEKSPCQINIFIHSEKHWRTALHEGHHYLPCFWHKGSVLHWPHLFIHADEATLSVSGVSQVIHCSPSLSDMCHSKACANKGNQFNDTASATSTVEREKNCNSAFEYIIPLEKVQFVITQFREWDRSPVNEVTQLHDKERQHFHAQDSWNLSG